MSYSNAPFVLRGCLSSQIASDRGEGGQQQRRAVGSALCLSALLGATDPHLRRRFGLGGWMPSSFVGRAAVLPRVSLVGAVAHISSDLFTEGIYGRSIRAYTDVQGCNRFLVCALENVSKKRTFFFLPRSFDSMGRVFDASGQQIARPTVPHWPVGRAVAVWINRF